MLSFGIEHRLRSPQASWSAIPTLCYFGCLTETLMRIILPACFGLLMLIAAAHAQQGVAVATPAAPPPAAPTSTLSPKAIGAIGDTIPVHSSLIEIATCVT